MNRCAGIKLFTMIVFPNAKINLGLRVINRRPDGFHTIHTLMIPVNLSDALEVTPSADGSFGLTVSGLPVEGAADDNLCVRAFRLMQKRFDLPEVRIHLHKVIPTGAGLGGGSSDAAFTVKVLNRLFNLKLCQTELRTIAAELGSDCPFFIENSAAFAGGRGDVLMDAGIDLSPYSIVLIKPAISVSTALAYSRIKIPEPASSIPQMLPTDIADWQTALINDFETPVFEMWPEIGRIKSALLEMGAAYAAMSGSGSAVFGIFRSIPVLKGQFEGMFVWTGKQLG